MRRRMRKSGSTGAEQMDEQELKEQEPKERELEEQEENKARRRRGVEVSDSTTEIGIR